MSEQFSVCDVTQPESMQLTDCVTSVKQESGSAIDEFEARLVALAKTSGMIDAAAHPDVLAEMFIISAVSSTESYFRRILSSLADICPITADNISRETLNYGAAAAYPRELLALALLERSLFSSKGVIVQEIKRFTKFDAAKHVELAAAIRSFETICLIRHAAAHWRGYIDSEGARRIGIMSASDEAYRVQLSSTLVQRAFAVCDHLVRLTNGILFNVTLRKWIDAGYIAPDGSGEKDADKCNRLLEMFGSREFCESRCINVDRLLEFLEKATE